MKKHPKLRKHTFRSESRDSLLIPLKTSTSFSSPWRTSHCSTNASSFSPKSSMALSKTRVSNARGSPRGTQIAQPPGREKIANAPPPGLTTWANAPRLPGGGGGWALLELTDALSRLHADEFCQYQPMNKDCVLKFETVLFSNNSFAGLQ